MPEPTYLSAALDRAETAEALLAEADWLLARLSFSTVADEDHARACAIARSIRDFLDRLEARTKEAVDEG